MYPPRQAGTTVPAVLRRIGYALSDIAYWLRRHLWAAMIVLLLLAGAGVGAYLALRGDDDEEEQAPPAASAPAPAPVSVIEEEEPPDEPTDLGFPAFATRNTTRVAGIDSIANAAGVALASFPSAGELEGPPAVALVDAGDWRSGIAAASLAAPPVGAPILLTEDGELPELTDQALAALGPPGSPRTDDLQAFVIGGAADPTGLRAANADGTNPAEIAEAVDRLRQDLTGAEPAHILLVSSREPEYAMPAASWSARSGDAVLFVGPDSVPQPTVDALGRHEDVPVYVLGPESVVSEQAFERIRELAPSAERIGEEGPVENAIAFARYVDGSFGWNINDPGHGLVIANVDRPLDAAAAAPLSAGGTWGPLLLTDDAAELPPALRGYLLDLKPGYDDDPTRAVYNHVWLIGDSTAISVPVQAQVDRLAEVAEIRSGSGGSLLAPAPGTPEPEAPDQP
jgi:hypothetical protein